MSQSYKNYEVIIVDNNSKDNTKTIVKNIKDKKIRYVFEKNKGRAAVRNKGISLAKGSIIAMIDCDCVPPKSWLKELSAPIIKDNEKIVMGFEKNVEKGYWAKRLQEEENRFIKKNIHGKYISHLSTQNFAVKTSFIRKFMFDSRFVTADDLELYLRIKNYAKVRFLENCIVEMHHLNTFRKVFTKNFESSYWTKMAFIKNREIKKEDNLSIVETKSAVKVIYSILKRLAKIIRNPSDSFFIISTGFVWNLGTLAAIIHQRYRK